MSHTAEPWKYAPVMQTGLTRKYERFDIYHETPDEFDNNYGVNTGRRTVFIGVIRSQASKTVTEGNAKRIVECVNACQGMDNPMSQINDLRQAVIKLMDAFDVGQHATATSAIGFGRQILETIDLENQR